jgi:hypothetical protein
VTRIVGVGTRLAVPVVKAKQIVGWATPGVGSVETEIPLGRITGVLILNPEDIERTCLQAVLSEQNTEVVVDDTLTIACIDGKRSNANRVVSRDSNIRHCIGRISRWIKIDAVCQRSRQRRPY